MVPYKTQIAEQVRILEETGQLALTKQYIPHGTVSVYEHCLAVAACSCHLAERFHIPVDYPAMIRGALLHDYFLYDWHIPSNGHRLHGFSHASTAARNALRDYHITPLEKDIIIHHMFPLNIIPPKSPEAWIVCMADKICAGKETWDGITGLFSRSRRDDHDA